MFARYRYLLVGYVLGALLLTSSLGREKNTNGTKFERSDDGKKQTARKINDKALPYSSADHYWPLNKIEKLRNSEFLKDLCGFTHAEVSDGVTTRFDDQLGPVVSLNTEDDSLVMRPLKSRCISDPGTCKRGITVEFWLKFRKGKYILSSGGYTKRIVGPGFILRHDSKTRRLVLQLSTTSHLWALETQVKRTIWVHYMFTWTQTTGLVLYENGKYLTRAEIGRKVRYPTFANKSRTLTVGAQDNVIKFTSGGRFEIGHLVIWTRSLSERQIEKNSFLRVVKQSVRSRICCRQKYEDRCVADPCYYSSRCKNVEEKYRCICPGVEAARKCEKENPIWPCRDTAKDCTVLAQQPNYCNYYAKQMWRTCAKSCQFCFSTPVGDWSSARSPDDDSKIMIVSIAVGVGCVLLLLIIIAIVIARINSKWQGEFVPDDNMNGTISPDHNTQEMISAAVDPAPRITDVPFKSSKAKKTSKMQLDRFNTMTSEI